VERQRESIVVPLDFEKNMTKYDVSYDYGEARRRLFKPDVVYCVRNTAFHVIEMIFLFLISGRVMKSLLRPSANAGNFTDSSCNELFLYAFKNHHLIPTSFIFFCENIFPFFRGVCFSDITKFLHCTNGVTV